MLAVIRFLPRVLYFSKCAIQYLPPYSTLGQIQYCAKYGNKILHYLYTQSTMSGGN